MTAIRHTAHEEQTAMFENFRDYKADVSLTEQALKSRCAHAEKCEWDAMKNNDNQRTKIYQLEGEVAKLTRHDETPTSQTVAELTKECKALESQEHSWSELANKNQELATYEMLEAEAKERSHAKDVEWYQNELADEKEARKRAERLGAFSRDSQPREAENKGRSSEEIAQPRRTAFSSGYTPDYGYRGETQTSDHQHPEGATAI